MTLDDLLATTRQALVDRLASPLLGSLAVAWCLWNWKFLVILFSSNTVLRTFSLVDSVAFPDTTTVLLRGLLYPLASAAAYIFVYPYPARFVYAFTLRRQREINQTRQSIADETPLTLEESRRLRAEYVERERKHAEVVRDLNEQVASLNAAIGAQKGEADPNPSPSREASPPALEPGQLSLLLLLEKLGSPASVPNILSASKQPKVKAEFDLGELERLKLVRRRYDQNFNEDAVDFTHDGRRELLAHKARAA